MFTSAKNPKNNKIRNKSGFIGRLAALVTLITLCCCLGLPPTQFLTGNFDIVNAEIDQADWNQPPHKGEYWPLAASNRLVVTSFSSEPLRNPSLEFRGTYINPQGRTVVRLVFRNYRSAWSNTWRILTLKAYDPFESLIDWDNQKTVMYSKSMARRRHDWYSSLDNTAASRFSPSSPDKVGATGVHEIDLNSNNNEGLSWSSVGFRDLPIDLVLKEGKTLSDLKDKGQGVDGLIDMRLMSKDTNRKVYTTTLIQKADEYELDKNLTPYFQYTTSGRVPFVASASADDSKWKFGLQDDIKLKGAPELKAANAYVRYGSDKFGNSYVEVVHRMAKDFLRNTDFKGAPFAYRQVFTPAFADILKPVTYIDENGNQEGNIAAIVYQADVSDNAYPSYAQNNFDAPKKDYCVRVRNDYINDSPDGKYKYIEVARENDQDGFVKTDGTSADPGVKIATNTANATQTFLNYAQSGFTGRPTITRYYVDPSKINHQALENVMFYSAILSANNARGFAEYGATTASPFTFSAGSTVNIDFDDNVTWEGAEVSGELQLIIGDKIMSIGMWSNIKKPRPAIKPKHYEWTVPFDITVPAGTKIRLMGDSEMNKDNIPQSGVTLSQGTQSLRLNRSSQNKIIPKIIQQSDTIAQIRTLETALEPNIQEIFTDDTKIIGHSYYKGALAEILPKNGDMEYKINYDPVTNTGDAPEPVTVKGQSKQGYRFTFEKPTENPQQNGWPDLSKDMPIKFHNTDVRIDAIPSESVVEQVQAKVVFDLNGGTMDTSGTSAPYSYTGRTSESDPVTRIAPLNKNYRKIENAQGNLVDNPAYQENGFETAEGAAENRRMVNGALADHDGEALTGERLEFRKYVTQKPKPPEGKVFKEWNTKKDGTGTKFESTTAISAGMTVYAIYREAPVVPTGVRPDSNDARGMLIQLALLSMMIALAAILRRKLRACS